MKIITIGLTGGIGSGKSTVKQLFTDLSVPCLEADQITHQLLKPDSNYYTKIIDYFGEAILDQHNNIQPGKLQQLIFDDAKKRQWLEELLHPAVWQTMQKHIKNLKRGYCLLEIPLLLETREAIQVDRILVVDAPEQLQIERTQQRTQLSLSMIKKIMLAQTSRRERLAKADDVIYNHTDTTDLKQQVAVLHQFYSRLSEPAE